MLALQTWPAEKFCASVSLRKDKTGSVHQFRVDGSEHGCAASGFSAGTKRPIVSSAALELAQEAIEFASIGG